MKQTFLNSGTYTYKPLKGKLDLEKYILSVLEKDTCCTKTLFADSATITTLTSTTSTVTSLITGSIAERVAAAGVSIDGLLIKDGGATANSMYASFYPSAVQTNIAAGTGGAIPVTNYLTTINTDAGGDAFTLAAGSQIGQIKKILLVVDGGGDATITLTGYTSIVMGDAGDYVILIWSGAAWFVLENSGSTVNV